MDDDSLTEPGKDKKAKKKRRERQVRPEGEITRSTCKMQIEHWRLAPKPHKRDECGGEKSCPACRTGISLYRARRLVTLASNVAMRSLFRADADAIDAFVFANGRLPGKGELEFVHAYSYEAARKAAPTLLSGVASTISFDVDRTWKRWRFDTLILQDRAVPHYKKAPIPVPASVYQSLRKHEGLDSKGRRETIYSIRFSLSSKLDDDPHQFELPIVPKDDYQAQVLENLYAGVWRLGEASIEEDKRRPGRWFLRLSYRHIVAPVEPSERVAAINRGLGCFLAVMAYTGESWVYSGADIIAVLKQFQSRRKGYQKRWRVGGDGSHGHGTKRALRATERLQGKAHRWRMAKIKTLARRYGEWLSEREISTLYLEDFSGIRKGAFADLGEYVGQLVQEFPYHMLAEALKSVCGELGIAVVEVPCAGSKKAKEEAELRAGLEEEGGIAETCPSCGHIDPDSMIFSTRTFKCTHCGFRRHLDVATAINVLVRGERRAGKPPMSDERKAQLLRGRAPLRGPSTERVRTMPEVALSPPGVSPRKSSHKGGKRQMNKRRR